MGGLSGCRGCWGCEVWAQRRSVDYRNVCFPSERLSQPNDAFGTRVRARSLDPSRSCSLPLAPTTHERGQRHCAPLTASRDRDKLANDRLLASPRLDIQFGRLSRDMGRNRATRFSLGRVPRGKFIERFFSKRIGVSWPVIRQWQKHREGKSPGQSRLSLAS